MHAADRGGRHFQDFDQFGAQRKDALRVRPYRHALILELGDRAGWTDRTVRHVRLGVDRLECTGIGGCRTLLDADGGILARQRLDHLEDARGIRQLGSQCPLRALAQRFARLDCLFFALGHDTEEGAVPHHRNHARHRLGGRFVGAVELRAIARRTDHPAVQHPRGAHVLHIHQAAGHLGRNVETRDGFSHDLVARERLRCHLGRCFPIEIGVEFAIADLAAVRRRDDAVGDLQLIRGHAEPLRREVDQNGASLGACHAQGRAAVLDRLAAGSLTLVRRLAGVAGDHPDASERQIDLLGGDLREGGENTLTQFDLSREDGRGAVGIYANPAVEPAIVLQAPGQPFLTQGKIGIERESHHERTKPGGETASRESGSVHPQVLPLAWAARSTARMIRLWVPQRQRLPASAARTSGSFGRGLRSSSSFADMIMPLVQ